MGTTQIQYTQLEPVNIYQSQLSTRVPKIFLRLFFYAHILKQKKEKNEESSHAHTWD